jgi:hypothetical protein
MDPAISPRLVLFTHATTLLDGPFECDFLNAKATTVFHPPHGVKKASINASPQIELLSLIQMVSFPEKNPNPHQPTNRPPNYSSLIHTTTRPFDSLNTNAFAELKTEVLNAAEPNERLLGVHAVPPFNLFLSMPEKRKGGVSVREGVESPETTKLRIGKFTMDPLPRSKNTFFFLFLFLGNAPKNPNQTLRLCRLVVGGGGASSLELELGREREKKLGEG